jgi:hypothetical protein
MTAVTIHLGWSAAYLTMGLTLGWCGHWLTQNGERVKQVMTKRSEVLGRRARNK